MNPADATPRAHKEVLEPGAFGKIALVACRSEFVSTSGVKGLSTLSQFRAGGRTSRQ